MNIDHNSERAELRCRASDSDRTPGEQAAIEEAERCEDLDRKYSFSSPSDAARFGRKAVQWRALAVKARTEDLST